MTTDARGEPAATPDLEVLTTIERRVLWLATRIVDAANRRESGEVKVGGHQASSASMVSIMTALWFGHLAREDKVAVKPHASPVYHAIKYLTGELDRSYLTTLRQKGGLQAYPSRTKDPDVADFSTGSVGLGAVAPLFSALTRRYVDDHFGARPDARFVALVGDAELDEGNVWEAIADPATDALGNVTIVVDLNRQSLDRIVPDIAATRLKRFFADAGWHVTEAKYGSLLTEAFTRDGGDALRGRIDAMTNEEYQSLFALEGPAMRQKFLAGADDAVARIAADHDDESLRRLVTDLGGHDLGVLLDISTNLGGWINKTGVYAHEERDDHGGADRLLSWAPGPSGRHIELGISEMNLFMLLGQLGLAHHHHGEQLLPIGTVYDPFVLRGLDALVYGLYNDARFVVAGTPSGVTLAPEGGAHQSFATASVGAELPGLHYCEPAYATEVDWLLCDAIDQLGRVDGGSTYLRLSTRPIDQEPFAAALERDGQDVLRRHVLAGGYRLRDGGPDGRPGVTIVTTGAMAPEALAAAATLDDEGVQATVVHLTSPDRTYRSWRAAYAVGARTARVVRRPSQLHRLVPPDERRRPVVSVHDAASHSLAWLGSALGTRQLALGVDRFGESGTVGELHEATGIAAGHVVNAALIAISEVSVHDHP